MLEQSLEQLKASLEAEKRPSAANHRRLVAENAGLIKQLREAQRDAAGAAPSRACAAPSVQASPSCRSSSTCCGEADADSEAGCSGGTSCVDFEASSAGSKQGRGARCAAARQSSGSAASQARCSPVLQATVAPSSRAGSARG